VSSGKKSGIEDSVSNFIRDDGINNPFEAPVGDKNEIL
jgi:hypothetical protein